MCKLYKDPSIDASYQVWVHLEERFQRRRFLKINQSKTRIACGGHVLTDQTKCAIFRGPSIDVSYQVSGHLAKKKVNI